MTPAQQALKDKLAKLKAAGGNSNGTVGNSQATPANPAPVEIKQEQEVQKVSEPEGQSSELQMAEKVLNNSETREKSGTEDSQVSTKENIPERISPQVQGVDHPIKMQLAELEQALNEKLPGFKTILRDIHAKLRQDPAIVTLLSDEEIGGILAGLKHHAQVEIIAPKAAKAKKASAKAIAANMSADDL